jgi:DNA-binding Lrp family transcriptional regulator
VSETTVLRRVQRLRDSGDLVMIGVPDPLRCGFGQPVLVQFRTAPGSAGQVARAVAERSDVRFVTLVTGKNDVICEFIVPDRRHLSRILLSEITELGEILGTTTEVVLRTFKTRDEWSRELLPNDGAGLSLDSAKKYSAGSKSPKMDPLDLALMAALGVDGRRSYVDLSNDLGLSETTLARRLNALVATRRLSFATLVDPQTLGFELEIFLHLRVDHSALESIAALLAARPEVRYASATAGYSDLTCEAIFRDIDALYNFMTNTLGQLKGVRDVEVDIELETVKRAFRYPLFGGDDTRNSAVSR